MKILLSGFCLLSFLPLSAQDSLTILFAGDAMMHQKQLDNTRRGDSFDLGGYFAEIEKEVKAADIAVVNFEVPLGGEPYSGYPAFSAPEDFALALQKAGFDFFLLANNHWFGQTDSRTCPHHPNAGFSRNPSCRNLPRP